MALDLAEFEGLAAEALLARALDGRLGRVAPVSSFGAESAVLLHMVAQIDPATPVLFLETGMLFPETLAYQRDLASRFGLADVRLIRPDNEDLAREDLTGLLHRRDPDRCCDLRKTAPLARALAGFDAWITGRKRFQNGLRAALTTAEIEDGRVKLNPLAGWRPEDIRAYILRHDLPAHPLAAKGFRSIGCAPCTTPVRPEEDPRAGRWRGEEKTECGIHFAPDGAPRRSSRPLSAPR